jgi:hypothetical protein
VQSQTLSSPEVPEAPEAAPLAIEPKGEPKEEPVVDRAVKPVGETVAVVAAAEPAAPVDPQALSQALDAVGLQWVQTDPNKAPAEASAEPPPKLGRKPRQTNQVLEAEPLVLVETRSSEQPPAS